MKKMVVCSIAFLSLSAFNSSTLAAQPGFYAGGGLGTSKIMTHGQYDFLGPLLASMSETPREVGGFGERLMVGYQVNPYAGFEFGFSHYAPSTYNSYMNTGSKTGVYQASVKSSLSALDLLAKLYLPIFKTGASVYGLGGVAMVRYELDYKKTITAQAEMPDTVAMQGSPVTRKMRPKFGGGVSYDIPRYHLTTSLEWSRIQGKGNTASSTDAIPNADQWLATLAYHFA